MFFANQLEKLGRALFSYDRTSWAENQAKKSCVTNKPVQNTSVRGKRGGGGEPLLTSAGTSLGSQQGVCTSAGNDGAWGSVRVRRARKKRGKKKAGTIGWEH